MSEDWDVDSYKTEHENEEHWLLRRNFMLAHKDKFPEDEIVCLANVFTNIEFMGCRYPEETMRRVSELAKGIVEKFRDQRKNSLKRTFVNASQAASAKVKGQTCKGEEEKAGPPNKMPKLSEEKSVQSSTRGSKYGGVKTFNINSNEQYGHSPVNKPEGLLNTFVLFLNNVDEHPVNIIQTSAAINKCVARWDISEGVGSLKVCKLYFDDQLVASGVGENMKHSKENTATVALSKLRECCYAIKVKNRFFSDTTVDSSVLKKNQPLGPTSNDSIGEDNIGRKLMKLMGWQGGGLGSREQGIEEPVAAALHVGRDGFGQYKNISNLLRFKQEAKDYIRAWMKSDSNQDLVFSSEFSSDERKAMHEYNLPIDVVRSKTQRKEMAVGVMI